MKKVPLAEGLPQQAAGPLRIFIADLHLDGLDSERSRNFRTLLERLAVTAAERPVELFILGDLFQFWYEYRSALFELYRADLEALEKASKAGVRIGLLHGNRDFAYGGYVRKRFNAEILGDGAALTLNDGRPAWLEHGDLLCTSDTRYLRFRSIIRSFPVRMMFFLMPWALARSMIEKIRRKTSADKILKDVKSLSIDLPAARRRCEATGTRVLLCGHTHTALSEDLGAGYRLIVLPPWCETPAGYVDDGALKPFSLQS